MKRILVMCTIFASASAAYAQTDNMQMDNTRGSNMPCITAPLSLTGNTKEVTVGANLPQMATEKTYVYYHRRRVPKRHLAPDYADLTDPRASNPILLSKDQSAQAMQPQTYRVTVSAPDDRVKVCSDTTLNLQANIDVQQESEYTGNYPTTGNKNYKLVSKHVYKKIARKMRNAEWKERKVARITGVPVHTSTAAM